MLRRSIGFALAVFSALVWTRADACTTFLLPGSPTAVMAKSYDWHMDHGLVVVNKRHVEKKALALVDGDRPFAWTSRYGSLTFNQYGREFPNSGVNEAGLAVEVMVLEESVYAQPDARPTLNETQWVQYQLDTAATVAEAIANARAVRLSKVLIPLHYLVCDESGACATFEFIDGQVVIHAGDSLPVPALTNDTYESSLAYLARFQGFGGSEPVPTAGLGSLTRFVKAADHHRRYDARATGDAVRYAFDGLAKVAGDDTQWRIVYELAAGRVHFRSLSFPTVKDADLGAFDLSCKTQVETLPVGLRDGGDATDRFHAFDPAENRRVIEASLGDVLPGVVELAASYPATTRCAER